MSISLAVSKIFEDIWNYIQNVSAFLILLYVLENNGQFIQKQINISSTKLQQDKSLHNNEKGLQLNSENGISKKSVSNQQVQFFQSLENININSEQALHQNQFTLIQPSNIESQNVIVTTYKNRLQILHGQNQNQNKYIGYEEQNNRCESQQNIFSHRDLVQNDNTLNQDQIISCETLLQNNIKQQDQQIFNNQLTTKLIPQVQTDLSYKNNNIIQKQQQKEDDSNLYFANRLSFNGDLTKNQIKKNHSVESQSPLLMIKRDIQIKKKEIQGSNQSIESVRINNIILKRMQSQEEVKNMSQQIQKQNSQQKKTINKNGEQQQNEKHQILECQQKQIKQQSNGIKNMNKQQSQILSKDQENIDIQTQQYLNNQFNHQISENINPNNEQQQIIINDRQAIKQNNMHNCDQQQIQNKEINTVQNLPDTPQLYSKGCISTDVKNPQSSQQKNKVFKEQNDFQQTLSTHQQQQNQMKLPSFSNLKNEYHLQNNFDEIIQNEKTKNQNSIKKNQNAYPNKQVDKNISNPDEVIKERLNVEQKNDIKYKLTFNDQTKDQQIQFKNNSKPQTRNNVRSQTQNITGNNDNSLNVRLKLHELEKNFQSNSDSYIKANQLINLQKCVFCQQLFQQNQKYSPTLQIQTEQQDKQKQAHKLNQQMQKRQSILQDQIEDDLRRIQYEKLIYEKIDCGIIILDQNISIIHKNKQIHEFFHQTEVNDNLMNCLKLVTVSDQSIVSLKQFLLSTSKSDKNKNIQQKQEINIQTIWGITQINQFLNRLNNSVLKEDPISLKYFLETLFQMFSQKQFKEQVNDLTLEVLQVLFTQKNVNQIKSKDGQTNPMFMSVQFKICFCYKSETKQYESIISLVNTRQRDISIKKQISESLSHRIFQTLSHEFGTYMNIISNITENALEDDRISLELKKDYFRIINTNSLLLENVIKNMRDFFLIMNQRLEIKWDNINLQETLFQTLELFKKQFQLKKLKVCIKIQKGVQQLVNSDGQFIKQILSNFISNSLKFTLQGQIKVFLFKHSDRQNIKININFYFQKISLNNFQKFNLFSNLIIQNYLSFKKTQILENYITSKRYLRLEVEDSGIGMTSEECERLQGMLKNGFTDEKISKNSVGLGFGLLISNNLARMIGNPQKKQAVYFQSHPKEGSKFWILINSSINKNYQHQIGLNYSKASSFSKQVYDSQLKSGNSNTVKNSQRSQQIQQEMIQMSINKQKSCPNNKNLLTNSIKSNSKPKAEIIKNEKSSPLLEKIKNKSNAQMQNQQLNDEKNISQNIITTDKTTNKPSLKIDLENLNSFSESKSEQRDTLSVNQNQIKFENDYQLYTDKKSPKAQSQMVKDISQKNITINEGNEFGQYLQKLIRQPNEKNLQKNSKRNSFNIQNLNQKFVSPKKQNIIKSTNLHGLGVNKREPFTPSQGISLESSQMISSKIIQIRSRVKHTIMNKTPQTVQQNNYLQISNTNEQTENLSIQSIDENNKANIQISKLPLSTFDTPNYLTMSNKKLRSATGQSCQGRITPRDGQIPQKLIKETLTYISQSNHVNQGSITSSHSNNQNSSSQNNPNPKTITNLSIISPNLIEYSNKNQNSRERPSFRCSLEKNLIPNNSQLISKHSSVNSFACVVSNPLSDHNNSHQLQINLQYNQTQQGKSSKYIEQRIVEETVEEDIKANQYSDNYSSNINENFTYPSSCSMTPKSNRNSSAKKQKFSKGVSIAEKFILVRQNSFQQQGSNQISTQNLRKSTNSTSTRKKNSDDSDSQNTLSDRSLSIEYVVQRDLIEYLDFEFDENHSLDDLDQTNQNKHKTLFQQLNAQSYGFSPNKINNINNGQQIPNIIFQQSSNQKLNIDKMFDDINVIPTRTMNDFKGQKSPKQSVNKQKQSQEFLDHRSSAYTEMDQDDDGDDYKVSIPSEREQYNDQIKQYDLNQWLFSKSKQNSESKGKVQKLQNTENASESKVVVNTSSRNNNDLSLHLTYNNQSQKLPSIAFNIKQQKHTTQSSILDQGVFSFGVDEKLFGGDNVKQNTQGYEKNQQTSNFVESKNIISQKNSFNIGSKRKNTLMNFNQQYLQIPFQQDNKDNLFLSPQLQQQQNVQYPYKILYNDQNSHQFNQDQQNLQVRFNSQSQFHVSNHTLSMMNIDEYEDYQTQLTNNNVYLNKNFENLQNQKKILLVDDEIFNIYSLKLIFSKFGLKDLILEAYNGQQAIELIMNQQNLKSKRNNELGYQIGMIIMDVNMPIMNGIECTKYIRELENNQTLSYSPNIIGYTAYSDSETKDLCYEAGMDDLLLKPSRRDDFISILEKYYLNC